MIEQNIKEMALLAVDALEDKKGEDITVIDISEVSVIADCFIIAGGSNKSQIQAMSDSVEEKLGRAGMPLKQSEGYGSANWILLDFGDIIVHILIMRTVYSMILKEYGVMAGRLTLLGGDPERVSRMLLCPDPDPICLSFGSSWETHPLSF